nr:hypothetical protein [Tanacetum cinerariifolium]
MNQNQIGRTVFDIDEESDAFYFQKAIEYHEWLLQQEAQPRLNRTPIFRECEDAERRLRADYFDDRSVIRQLAYGTTPDAFDEYLQMSERTAPDSLTNFNKCIISLYMAEYLRKLTLEDIENGQYGRGDKKYPNIMLEAVASQDLWIWHAFFGVACANNDINVLDNSPLFDDLLNDRVSVLLCARQEGARKDVERAFGVLQGRWGIIQQPARSYHVNTLRRVMYSCIILHNMILKDQKMVVFDWNEVYANPARNMQRTTQRWKNKEMRDRDTHVSLQQNLMEHI